MYINWNYIEINIVWLIEVFFMYILILILNRFSLLICCFFLNNNFEFWIFFKLKIYVKLTCIFRRHHCLQYFKWSTWDRTSTIQFRVCLVSVLWLIFYVKKNYFVIKTNGEKKQPKFTFWLEAMLLNKSSRGSRRHDWKNNCKLIYWKLIFHVKLFRSRDYYSFIKDDVLSYILCDSLATHVTVSFIVT